MLLPPILLEPVGDLLARQQVRPWVCNPYIEKGILLLRPKPTNPGVQPSLLSAIGCLACQLLPSERQQYWFDLHVRRNIPQDGYQNVPNFVMMSRRVASHERENTRKSLPNHKPSQVDGCSFCTEDLLELVLRSLNLSVGCQFCAMLSHLSAANYLVTVMASCFITHFLVFSSFI